MRNPEELRKKVVDRLLAVETDEAVMTANVLDAARIGDHWGHDEGVIIGPFRDLREFCTLAFHEAGHIVLSAGANSLGEEKQCHNFSKEMCKSTGLPFSEGLKSSCLTIARLTLSNDSSDRGRIHEIVPRRYWVALTIWPQTGN